MNEGDVIELRFDRIAPKGDAVAHVEGVDKPIYASGVIPGEVAKVTIRRVRRNWVAVEVDEIIAPSPDRVEPRCPLFTTCSGCQLQHIRYERQLELKRDMVVSQLRTFGRLEDPPVDPVIGAKDPWYYRNHARFTLRDGQIGFIRRFRKQWFPVPHCAIMEPTINTIMGELTGKLHGMTQCNVRVGAEPGQAMIQPKIGIPEVSLPSGQPHLFETLGGHPFRVSAASFFQVNRAQAEVLTEVVRAFVADTPDVTVVDAYAGVGTFAVMLAPHVRKVIAIEESGPAVADAQLNVAAFDNIELRLGKSEVLLGELPKPVDAIILDPPRSGCRPEAITAVRHLAPRRLVYVSCDPSSLGRDLEALLADDIFVLRRVTPIDMFPHTHHVECVAMLERKDGAPCSVD